MRISFRQGIVRAPANFLQLASGHVSLTINPTDPLVVTFADNSTNYLVSERSSVSNAWADNFVAGVDYWLYIDINTVSGVRTFGSTTLSPSEGPTAPANPAQNQHWFDTANNIQKVWVGSTWVRKIRVFVAQLQQGSIFKSVSIDAPLFTGTQIGSYSTTPAIAGAIVYDGAGIPLRKSDNTFFTTEDTAITGIASSSQVKFGSLVIPAIAVSNIAAYSIVRFSDFNQIATATNYLIDDGTYGIVESDAVTGDILNVVMEGLITNPAWDWTSAGINATLYVDSIGHLTTTVPPTPIAVGAVVDAHTILLRPSSLFLNTSNDPATMTDMGSVYMSVPPANTDQPTAVGTNDPRITAVTPHISDQSVHLTSDENTFLDSLTTKTSGIVSYNATNHTASTIVLTGPTTGLTITNGDGITGNPTIAIADDLAALEGMTTTGVAVRNGPSSWVTRQVVIGNDSVNNLSIVNGDGVAGNPTISFTGDLAAITSVNTNGIVSRTSNGNWTTRSIAAPLSGLTITNGDGIAGNPTIALANDLAAVENMASTGLAVRTGDSTWDTTSIIGQSGDVVITNSKGYDTSSATTAPVTISLATAGTPVNDVFKRFTTDTRGRVVATSAVTSNDIIQTLGYTPLDVAGSNAMSSALNMANFVIANVASPINPLDAANKQYVDSVAQGLDPKQSVRLATTASVVLNGTQVVDGITANDGDRVLVKNQADATTNGIYNVVAGGAWVRSTDATPGTSLNSGAFTFVEDGTTNAKTGWVLSAHNPIVSGSTLLTWQQFSGAGEITAGTGIVISGNTMSLVPSSSNTLTISPSNIDLTVMPGVGGNTYKSVTIDTFGRVTAGTNPTTLSGYGITDAQPLNSNLTNLSAVSTTGVLVRSGTNTFTTRTLVGVANQINLSLGDGTTGNPTIGLSSDPIIPGNACITIPAGTTAQEPGGASDGAVRYNNTTSTMRMHEAGSWKNIGTMRSISFTAPDVGFTVTQTTPTTDTSTVTFALNGELQGVQSMNSFGLSARTNTGTWTTRTIQGTAGNVIVSNGNGIASDPVIDLAPNIVAVGTYRSVTVDTFGRVTAGTNPTTLSGYGITDAQPLNVNLSQLAAYNTNGFVTQIAPNSFAGRVWQVGTNSNTNLVLTNPDGIAGNPSISLAGDLLAVSQLNATGFAVRTGAQTWAQRQLTGASNRITVTNPTGVSTDPLIDISASYSGQTSISTVGTITAGTWNGSTVSPQYGGTGLNTLGGGNTVLGINAAGSGAEYKTVNGTANQVTVTHGVGTITLATPQNIDTSANVQFNAVSAKQHVTTVQALTDAATVAVDLSSGIHCTLLATSAVGSTRSIGNPSNATAGTIIVLKFNQDATGGRDLTFGTAYKFAGGTAPTFASQSGNVSNIITFWCDGTNLYEMSRSLNIS